MYFSHVEIYFTLAVAAELVNHTVVHVNVLELFKNKAGGMINQAHTDKPL